METKRITIDGKRYDLSGMVILPYDNWYDGGVAVKAVYYGPRSKRLIIKTDSRWESRTNPGCCVGTEYQVVNPDSDDYGYWIERLERNGVDLPDAPLPVVTEDDALAHLQEGSR